MEYALALMPEDILRLLLALAIGGAIGAERELRDKAAGFRTMMFICAGSALFTIFSVRLAQFSGATAIADPTRIAAQIVSGVGFLGAGAILREGGEIRGLTTAATVWLAAALGMGVGGGLLLFSIGAAAIILVALLFFPSLERMMGTISQVRTYHVTCPISKEKYQLLNGLFHGPGLRVLNSKRTRHAGDMMCGWTVVGPPDAHEALVESLLEDPDVQDFEF